MALLRQRREMRRLTMQGQSSAEVSLGYLSAAPALYIQVAGPSEFRCSGNSLIVY